MAIRKKETEYKRRLNSKANNNEIEKTWHNFSERTVVAVMSDMQLSIARVASETSPDGKLPQLIVLTNTDEDRYTIITNREAIEETIARKLMSDLLQKLNGIDPTVLRHGTEWTYVSEKNTLRSPNHGDTTSLRLGAVVNAIREIHMAEETQAEKVLRDGGVKGIKAYVKTLKPDGFKGKIEEGNGKVIITLGQ